MLFLSLILITSIVGILGNSIVSPSNAQNTIKINKIQIESSPVDLVKIIQDNEPLIKVEYQSGYYQEFLNSCFCLYLSYILEV